MWYSLFHAVDWRVMGENIYCLFSNCNLSLNWNLIQAHFSKHLSMHLMLGLFLSFSFHRLFRQVRVKTIFKCLDESGRSFFTVANDKWSKHVNFWLKCVHSTEVNYLVGHFPTRKKSVLLCIALTPINCSLPHKMPEVEPHFASSEFNTVIGLWGGKRRDKSTGEH